MSFISETTATEVPAGSEIEDDANEVLAQIDAADAAVSEAHREAQQMLAALERSHIRLSERLGVVSPFAPRAASGEAAPSQSTFISPPPSADIPPGVVNA